MTEMDDRNLEQVSGGQRFNSIAWMRRNCEICSKQGCDATIATVKTAEKKAAEGIDYDCPTRS